MLRSAGFVLIEPRVSVDELRMTMSAFGESVVAEMNRLGMMVDVSHISKNAALHAMRVSGAPVIASHSSAFALADHARNMDDETLMALRENGGVMQTTAFPSYVKVQPPEREEELRRLRDANGFQYDLEDGTVAAGANSDDPFVEIFLDQWKGLSIHVPPSMREEVEAVLSGFELQEVAQTWDPSDGGEGTVEPMQTRPVLDVDDASDVDELLLELRRAWRLELNIDPETNVDESGRRLGLTLWHAVVVVADAAGAADRGGYASIWATAGSLQQMEGLIEGALEEYPEWKFQEIYAIDRVAYDERPEALVELPPRSTEAAVHQVYMDTWESPPEPIPEPPDG